MRRHGGHNPTARGRVVTLEAIIVSFLRGGSRTSAHALPTGPSGGGLPSLASKLCAHVVSLHERTRVLQMAMAVLSKYVVSGNLYKGGMTNRARSLVPLGAGVMAGLTARP